MIVLESAILRANPAYHALPFNRLTPAVRQALTAAQAEPDGYGMLVPQPGSTLPPVAVCRETALLFLTLRSPTDWRGAKPPSSRSARTWRISSGPTSWLRTSQARMRCWLPARP